MRCESKAFASGDPIAFGFPDEKTVATGGVPGYLHSKFVKDPKKFNSIESNIE